MLSSDSLIGHIIENNACGDIRFIDSALATLQMKKLLHEESCVTSTGYSGLD